MDHLVSTDWLAEHLADPDLVVLDATVHLRMGDAGFEAVSGREDWARGHVPGAGFADLTGALCDPDSPLRFALPAPEVFAAAMADLGVADGRRVVLYDANGSMWAARVWWMLRWIGFDDAALLDGGLGAWTAEGRPLDTSVRSFEPATLAVRVRPELVADKGEVAEAIGDGATCIVDALNPAMYTGEVAMYRRGRSHSRCGECAGGSADRSRHRPVPPTRRAGVDVRPRPVDAHHHLLRWRDRRVGRRIRADAPRLRRRRGVHREPPGMGRRPRRTVGDRTADLSNGRRRLAGPGPFGVARWHP